MIQTEILKSSQPIDRAHFDKPIVSFIANPAYSRSDSRINQSQNPIVQYESLIDKINKRISKNEKWYSLEFFPPKTQPGASNLIAK